MKMHDEQTNESWTELQLAAAARCSSSSTHTQAQASLLYPTAWHAQRTLRRTHE